MRLHVEMACFSYFYLTRSFSIVICRRGNRLRWMCCRIYLRSLTAAADWAVFGAYAKQHKAATRISGTNSSIVSVRRFEFGATITIRSRCSDDCVGFDTDTDGLRPAATEFIRRKPRAYLPGAGRRGGAGGLGGSTTPDPPVCVHRVRKVIVSETTRCSGSKPAAHKSSARFVRPGWLVQGQTNFEIFFLYC